MQMEKAEKQIGSRDRRFVAWSRADALVRKTGQSFDEVLPEAMAGMKLTSTDLRGVLDLQKVNEEIRQAILGSSAVSEAPATPQTCGSWGALDGLEDLDSVPDLASDDENEREARLLAARDRVITHLHEVRALPCHAIPFPRLGVTFFMVGKITVDGDNREWNHNGKHTKFKALIPDCELKIIPLNGETFPKPFFFENWTWQAGAKDQKTLCSGNLKVFCLKHEPGTEYVCWVNPGGKGDPWRFLYKMTPKGLELTRYRLKPDSKSDYIRLDVKPVLIGSIPE